MRRKIIFLFLLFLIAVATRVWRAYQQPVVNPDAIRFVDQAKLLEVDPLRALREEPYHPLMAAVALLVRPLVSPFVSDDRLAWLAALQVVGIVCGSLVALQIFYLARALGTSFWLSLAAGLIWATGHRSTSYGPDGLSDMLFLALFAAAILLAISATRRRQSFSTLRFFLVGILSGLAYLTRPEGLALPLIFLATICTGLFLRTRKPRRFIKTHAILAALCIVAGTLLPALPYMLVVGGVTHKQSLPLAAAILSAIHDPSMPRNLSNATAEIVMRLRVTLGFGPFMVLCGAILLAPYPWGRPRLRLLVTIWAALWIIVMYWLFMRTAYIDGRHTLILQLLLHALLGLAFTIWTKPMRWWMNFWRRRPAWNQLPAWSRWKQWPQVLATGVFLFAVIPGICFLPEIPRAEKTYVRQAAAWLNTNTPHALKIYDSDLLLGYYADHPYARLEQLDPSRPALVALMARDIQPPPPTAHLIALFPAPDDALLIYLLLPGTTAPIAP